MYVLLCLVVGLVVISACIDGIIFRLIIVWFNLLVVLRLDLDGIIIFLIYWLIVLF